MLTRALVGRYPFDRVAHCAAETGMLMFDPRGDVYSCWEEIGATDRRIGGYAGGVLDVDGDALPTWLSRFPGAIDQCSRCPYALIHTSGCGNHARADAGSVFAAACEGFQAYFPRTLAEAYGEVERRSFGEREPVPRRAHRPRPVPVTIGRYATTT